MSSEAYIFILDRTSRHWSTLYYTITSSKIRYRSRIVIMFKKQVFATRPRGYILMWLARFSATGDVSGQTIVKSSTQRSIRSAILSQWRVEPETLETFWPKKETLTHVKWSVRFGSSDMKLNLPAVGSICRFIQSTASQFSSNNQMVHFIPLYVYCINVRRAILFAPLLKLIYP